MRARVPPPHPLIRFGIMTFERRGPSPLMSFNLKSALELGAQRLMRAYVLKHYGDPEGSQLMDVPAPMPRPGDVLVAVRAAGLNPVDFKFRQGKLRAIQRPKLPFVLGNELSGEVIATGRDVRRFRIGDRVFARVGKERGGAFAEQACVNEEDAAPIP